jgi:hypothetical protein
MTALPKVFYGDPSECVDEIRKMRDAAKRQAERNRQHKSRRIRALVKLAMRGVR